MSFPSVPPALLVLGTLLGAAVMIAWRLRESSRPVTARAIVAPPLGMSTGLVMFLFPPARVPWAWAAGAFAVGAVVLAIPLARSSRLVREGPLVMVQRSRAFLWILLGLVAVRLLLRAWIERAVTPVQSGGLLFLLAFGMVVRWRAAMYLEYLRVRAAAPGSDPAPPSP
jgi:membrane protein CcdC involved in cytochrome C biogenesis